MRIRVAREPLAAALKAVLPVAGGRGGVPLLLCFRLQASEATLTIEATDLETTIRRRLGGVEVEEEGVIAVPAKALSKTIDSIPDEEVSLESNGTHVTVRAGGRAITLAAQVAQDWPECGTGSIDDPSILASAEALGEALVRASTCASKDEARPVLTAIALQLEQGSTTMQIVASDSYRLGALEVQLHEAAPVTELVLLSARAVRQAATQMRKGGGIVAVRLHDEPNGHPLVTFEHAATTWSFRRMQGEFPNWRQIIPSQVGAVASLDVAEVVSALKTVNAVRTARNVPVRLSLGEGCSLSLIEHDGAHVRENLRLATFHPEGVGDMEIAFNPDYLADALRFVGSERVEVHLQDNLKPATFGTPQCRYVLMPVRI